jgi:hypothetical protein
MFQVLCSPLGMAASTIDSFDVFNILEPIDFHVYVKVVVDKSGCGRKGLRLNGSHSSAAPLYRRLVQ